MKYCLLLLAAALLPAPMPAHAADDAQETLERNKQLAREFYQDLWFSRNTDKYDRYMAETYVAHDIGERKNMTEPAIEQKKIADFFWENGEMSGHIDYQVAEGDLVATRWQLEYEPSTLLGHMLMGNDKPLPIINVFRFKDGKIVELWNHRHDIDTGMTYRFVLKGFVFGLLIALLPLIWVVRLKKKLKALRNAG